MENLTPREVVAELDKYIVGQLQAKKCVAVALRNRYRRKLLPPQIQEEIAPKNIIMIGPTGVGKTEIARRLAKLVNAPFVKVEATKFTEVGYVGRDVDSMVRDLVETAIRMVRNERMAGVAEQAERLVEARLLDLMAPIPQPEQVAKNPLEILFGGRSGGDADPKQDELFQQRVRRAEQKRAVVTEKMGRRELENEMIEIEVEDHTPPTLEVFTGAGMEEMGINLQDILGGILPKKKRKRRLPVSEARKLLMQEEAYKLIDMDEVTTEAVRRSEQEGIIFLDEIDKIAATEKGVGPDVSRGGVQRDILPIVEGSTVMTKYGPVKTDHILFIAAGAFHISKPSDLIPELQGRFPIRVELDSLSQADFKQILVEPENSLIKQYTALLSTEGIKVEFTEDAIAEIAQIAYTVNTQTENIGARRLHTILERVLQELFFEAPELVDRHVQVDCDYVRTRLDNIFRDRDLSRYIL
ncbi:Clp protease ATPase [Clostridiales bacterium PH28_bin88]|nr:Clp protease ATPase [Clostridiales bacterium PH28_bin88]